jgi:hypothetical protein
LSQPSLRGSDGQQLGGQFQDQHHAIVVERNAGAEPLTQSTTVFGRGESSPCKAEPFKTTVITSLRRFWNRK